MKEKSLEFDSGTYAAAAAAAAAAWMAALTRWTFSGDADDDAAAPAPAAVDSSRCDVRLRSRDDDDNDDNDDSVDDVDVVSSRFRLPTNDHLINDGRRQQGPLSKWPGIRRSTMSISTKPWSKNDRVIIIVK